MISKRLACGLAILVFVLMSGCHSWEERVGNLDPTSVPNPSPTSTPLTLTLAAQIPDLPFLSLFPLYPGTTWTYTKTGYTQTDSNPDHLIHGTSHIVEQVIDLQSVGPYTLVHIQGRKTMVSADAGWQENGLFGLGNYEYWYVIHNNQIFLSYALPDPASLTLDKMMLAYQFPFQVGSEWCLGSEIKGQPIPDIRVCGSKAIISAEHPYSSRIGELKPCYEIHHQSNSGDVISQFCEGVGIVAVKYDHAGTRFGETQELTNFVNGKDHVNLNRLENPLFVPTKTILSVVVENEQMMALYRKMEIMVGYPLLKPGRLPDQFQLSRLSQVPTGYQVNSKFRLRGSNQTALR